MNKRIINEDIAELYGALIGDGCLSTYFSKYDNRQRYCFLLTGHTHDFAYYENVIRPILFREFNTEGYIRFRKNNNVVRFETYRKDIFVFFKGFGFPVGLKTSLKIPQKIFSDNRLAISCVRGIFDTDGSIYRRYSKKYPNHSRLYNHKVIQFRMNSHKILKQIQIILSRNKIKTTKIGSYGKSFVVRITSQKDINRFMELIQPNNTYHTERYLNSL